MITENKENSTKTALIVDDEQDLLDLLRIILATLNVETQTADCLQKARNKLKKQSFDFCLTDLRLPDGDGLELVDEATTAYPEMPIAVITAYGSVERAVEALKLGAFDFVSKPVDIDVVRKLARHALRLKGKTLRAGKTQQFIGESSAMELVKQQINRLARSQAPVLILGESGTGKELAAREIHRLSPRNQGAFIAVNCGAIPSELMESEFFGHKKGSFTGATTDKTGLIQAAEAGTLFLDEIAELPLVMQVKLLRAIQQKAVKPIGYNEEIDVDVRIISATHRNIQKWVEDEKFRLDLYYRINVISLHIPPLRERVEDIAPLARFILHKLTGAETIEIETDALTKLEDYGYPGNVRELENILERALAFCEGQLIKAKDIQINALKQGSSSSKQSESDRIAEASEFDETDEKNQLIKALEQNHWNRTQTAKRLGLSLRQIRYRIKKYKLDQRNQ